MIKLYLINYRRDHRIVTGVDEEKIIQEIINENREYLEPAERLTLNGMVLRKEDYNIPIGQHRCAGEIVAISERSMDGTP